MLFNFTLKDLNDAFKEYCEDLVSNIDNLSEEQKKEGRIYNLVSFEVLSIKDI